MACESRIGGFGIATFAAAVALALFTPIPMAAVASPDAEHAPRIDEASYPSDESALPFYMRNWDLMEPIFDPYNTELGNYAVNWDWNQDGAEGAIYYLQEASTQEFLMPNVTTHYDTKVLMTGKPNGTYWYRVKVVKGELSSNWSRADSLTVSIKPIDPDGGVIVHSHHHTESGLPYLTEKVEFFMNVPSIIRVGDDPDTSKRYAITLREMSSKPVKLAVLEIAQPHKFFIVTENESKLDIDGDGVEDLNVQYKGQHENGQAYVAFTIIDKPESQGVSYYMVLAVAAAVLSAVYGVVRLRGWKKRQGHDGKAAMTGPGGRSAE
jgi:hypothetical protein